MTFTSFYDDTSFFNNTILWVSPDIFCIMGIQVMKMHLIVFFLFLLLLAVANSSKWDKTRTPTAISGESDKLCKMEGFKPSKAPKNVHDATAEIYGLNSRKDIVTFMSAQTCQQKSCRGRHIKNRKKKSKKRKKVIQNTRPITPSFVHRISQFEVQRSKGSNGHFKHPSLSANIVMGHANSLDPVYSTAKGTPVKDNITNFSVKEAFETPKDNCINTFERKQKTMIRSEVLKSTESAIMAIFAICDEDHSGAVHKRSLCQSLYNSACCALVRECRPLKPLIRRRGFVKEVKALRTREKGVISYDEFHALAFREHEEQARREAEEKERKINAKRVRRLQQLREDAWQKKRDAERQEVQHEIDLKHLEIDLQKKQIMDNRADNVRQKASTRKFVHNLTETAGKKALNIIEEASQDASSKTKQAMTMSQKIRLKAQKEVAEMMKMEEEQMKASTKLAEEEINRRWELEKKQMATLRRQMLQEAKERKSMEDAEREERIVMEKELIQTMKDNATREITDFRRKTVQEVEQMRKEAKEERERMLAQQLVEQQLFRDRAEEAKETLLKQTRWEMKVVMERVHEQAEVKKAAAEEEVKAILSRGHEQVRIAQSQYHQNVRVLEAMDSFKRTVTVEISKKLELENQRKEAKQKMEEAAIKRQRAEASLRAKQDAIKKKEKQLKESRYKQYLSEKQQQDRQQQLEDDEENRKQGEAIFSRALKKKNPSAISDPYSSQTTLRPTAKSGWRELTDPSTGYPYYENIHTGESQWERPKGF